MKLFKCFLFLIFPLVVGTACNDDKDEPREGAVLTGEWECILDAYGDFWDEPLIFVFNEDGTGYEWFSDEPFANRMRFTYTATSSALQIKSGSDSYTVRYELSSDGNSLALYGLDDDDMYELHFTRVG